MDLTTYLTHARNQHLEELFSFLRIPSVSALSEHIPDVKQAAEFALVKLTELGFKGAVYPTQGHPVVFAEYQVDPSLPTVLVYGHYDVQPPDPLELWESEPFKPFIKDGAIIARGASDDKGQVYAHIKGAESLLKTSQTLPVNLKFLIEGEEEIGSPNLSTFIDSHKDLLAADVVVISDGSMFDLETPSITYGLKGLAYIEVHVKTAALDLHSGGYGGGVPNPINSLAKMIARLHDDQGRVAVPGFYDAVLEISPEEKAALARVPFDEADFAQEIGVSATPGEAGYSLLERLWARPTLDCNGIKGGFQGEGAKTVIPREAMAKISCRLVPNQEPKDIAKKLEDYLKAIAPAGVSVSVNNLNGGFPGMTPIDASSVRAAASALQQVYGKEPLFVRTGGTIPVVSTFQHSLHAEVVLVGLGLDNDRAHSPNEKFELINYYRGIEVSAALLKAMASVPKINT